MRTLFIECNFVDYLTFIISINFFFTRQGFSSHFIDAFASTSFFAGQECFLPLFAVKFDTQTLRNSNQHIALKQFVTFIFTNELF